MLGSSCAERATIVFSCNTCAMATAWMRISALRRRHAAALAHAAAACCASADACRLCSRTSASPASAGCCCHVALTRARPWQPAPLACHRGRPALPARRSRGCSAVPAARRRCGGGRSGAMSGADAGGAGACALARSSAPRPRCRARSGPHARHAPLPRARWDCLAGRGCGVRACNSLMPFFGDAPRHRSRSRSAAVRPVFCGRGGVGL